MAKKKIQQEQLDPSISFGGGEWGSITGSLASQTDLQAALDAKADDADLAGKVNDTGDTITGKVSITSAAADTSLQITPSGSASSSSSTGGAVNITNTNNDGAGLVVYSNKATASGHLAVVRSNQDTFNQHGVFLDYRGTNNAMNIVRRSPTSGTVSSSAFNMTSENENGSAVQVRGKEKALGTVKITHENPSTTDALYDANAAALSLDVVQNTTTGVGTAAQGLYIDSSTGTTGRLIRARNLGVDKFVVDKDGNVTVAGTVSTDDISEKTAAAGVTIDGVLLKDGNVGGVTASIEGTTSTDISGYGTNGVRVYANKFNIWPDTRSEVKVDGDTITSNTATQTLTNKTLTNPKINSIKTTTTNLTAIDIMESGGSPAVQVSAGTTGFTSNGAVVVNTSDTQTLTNKRITPRGNGTTTVLTTGQTLTPSVSNDVQNVRITGNMTIAAPTGTALNNDKLLFRILCDTTAGTITWNAIYRAIGVTLPTTTVANKTMYIGMVYNSADTKWDVIAVSQEA